MMKSIIFVNVVTALALSFSCYANGNIPALAHFNVTVSCDAHSVNGGNPAKATQLVIGIWENGEKNIYILEGTQIKVGLGISEIMPNGAGSLVSEMVAKDLDSGESRIYGKLKIQFASNGVGAGALASAFESSEPYVLGSMELRNCRSSRM